MGLLIAKQNISRRFRQVPSVKRSSPLFAFGLSGQRPGKRPQAARSEANKGTFTSRSFRGVNGVSSTVRAPRTGKDFAFSLKDIVDRMLRKAAKPADSGYSVAHNRDRDREGRFEKRLGIIALSLTTLAALMGLGLATMRLSDNRFPLREADFALPVQAEGLDLLTVLETASPTEDFQPESGMIATELPLSLAISYHTLQRGQTVDSVAKMYGRDRDSIISMNGIVNVKRVSAGTKLKIPNMNGIIHVVRAGESLGKIAARYKTDVVSLLDANNLESYSIQKGQSLFIPGGKLDKGVLGQVLGVLFSWPVRGYISSAFAYRNDPFSGVRRFHNALDIAGYMGQRINVVTDGRIAETGYNTTFGNYIIVSHEGGFQTFYAHLSKITAVQGAWMNKGTKIGEMGNTGYSTGTHLHFAVYRKGVAVDPRRYLTK